MGLVRYFGAKNRASIDRLDIIRLQWSSLC